MKRNLLVMALCVWVIGACYCNTPSSGQKVGQVVRLSREGIFNDTWEGQLIRGGFTDGSGTIGTVPFEFTVEREEDARRLEEFMQEQTEIRLTYRTEGIVAAWRSGSAGHFFVSAEPLAKAEK